MVKWFLCQFEGTKCKAKFKKENKLKRHIECKHLNLRLFKCTFDILNCNKTYKRKDHLQRHINSVHKKEKLFKCNYANCNLRFNQKYHLNRHIKCVHGPPQYKCEFCMDKFQKKRTLKKHIQLKHNEFCKFICNQCNKRYSRKCDLNRHQIKHKKEDNKCIETKKNIFICNKCNKPFNDELLFKNHLLIENRIKSKNNKSKTRKIINKKKNNILTAICGKLQ